MPEGTDKDLLKHIGIRMDRDGWAYDFYYDEANEVYFVEILQEGEAKDGTVGTTLGDREDIGNRVPACDHIDDPVYSDRAVGISGEECEK